MTTPTPDLDARSDGTYHFVHDWSGPTELATEILLALQAVAGEGVTEQGPLYRRLDPEALDDLFAPVSADTSRDRGEVSFPFQGHAITVRATGDILIEPAAPTDCAAEVEQGD